MRLSTIKKEQFKRLRRKKTTILKIFLEWSKVKEPLLNGWMSDASQQTIKEIISFFKTIIADEEFINFLKAEGKYEAINTIQNITSKESPRRKELMKTTQQLDALLKEVQESLDREEKTLQRGWQTIEAEKPNISIIRGIGHYFGRLVIKKFANNFKKRVGKYSIAGLENLPATGPVIIASRHCIDMEYALFVELLPRRVFYVANIRRPSKDISRDQVSLFDPDKKRGSQLAKWSAKNIFNLIQLYDPQPKDLLRAFFGEVGKAIAKDGCLVIFPEGCVLAERNLLWGPFETGTIIMAMMAQRLSKKKVPILPMGICYEWPDPRRREGKPNVYFRLGEPIITNEIPGVNSKEKTFWLENKIKSLSAGRPDSELTYEELRKLDPETYFKMKVNLRKEMAAKEIQSLLTNPATSFTLLSILNEASSIKKLTPAEQTVWNDFLRVTLVYLNSSVNARDLDKERKQFEEILQLSLKEGAITKEQQETILRVYGNPQLYAHERHIFHNSLDDQVRRSWERLLLKRQQ